MFNSIYSITQKNPSLASIEDFFNSVLNGEGIACIDSEDAVESVKGRLEACIYDLEELERDIVTLKLWEDCSTAEIAHELGISQVVASSLYAQSLQSLKDSFLESSDSSPMTIAYQDHGEGIHV